MSDEFNKAIRDCQHALQSAQGIDLSTEIAGAMTDFKSQQQEASRRQVWATIDRLEKAASTLDGDTAMAVNQVIPKLRKEPSIENLMKITDLIDAGSDTSTRKEQVKLDYNLIPDDIRPEVIADAQELEKCLSSGCYRSAVIICGRILETALHRKYYEATGNDLLEKAPGIGLGNVIAKMNEKGISLDPGLPNQIHLINQVRVWSVHKKQQPFTPSAQQAKAIALYTFDVVEKLWVV